MIYLKPSSGYGDIASSLTKLPALQYLANQRREQIQQAQQKSEQDAALAVLQQQKLQIGNDMLSRQNTAQGGIADALGVYNRFNSDAPQVPSEHTAFITPQDYADAQGTLVSAYPSNFSSITGAIRSDQNARMVRQQLPNLTPVQQINALNDKSLTNPNSINNQGVVFNAATGAATIPPLTRALHNSVVAKNNRVPAGGQNRLTPVQLAALKKTTTNVYGDQVVLPDVERVRAFNEWMSQNPGVDGYTAIALFNAQYDQQNTPPDTTNSNDSSNSGSIWQNIHDFFTKKHKLPSWVPPSWYGGSNDMSQVVAKAKNVQSSAQMSPDTKIRYDNARNYIASELAQDPNKKEALRKLWEGSEALRNIPFPPEFQ